MSKNQAISTLKLFPLSLMIHRGLGAFLLIPISFIEIFFLPKIQKKHKG